jgi:cysteine desulfurase family protein (TIGR01976 family)
MKKNDPLDMRKARLMFPALLKIGCNGLPYTFFDGGGGTQTPRSVTQSMEQIMESGISNVGDLTSSSRGGNKLMASARSAIATLIGANSGDNVIFGGNMSSLTLMLSRPISQSWVAGDEIILSEADHAANRTFWEIQATSKDIVIHYVGIREGTDCEFDMGQYASLLNERTKFVAVSAASNLVGTVNDLVMITKLAHKVGAKVFVDAVALLAHQNIDVSVIGCDFLAGSVHKFFGPNLGFIYGSTDALISLTPIKVAPAPISIPRVFEIGTPNFVSLAGAQAAVQYIASLGDGCGLRSKLNSAYEKIQLAENKLSEFFIDQISSLSDINLIGINSADMRIRTPTFALTFNNHTPQEVCEHLAQHGINTWSGHLYAERLVESLGLSNKGGVLRLSFTHYNTTDEVSRCCKIIENFLYNPADSMRRTYTSHP